MKKKFGQKGIAILVAVLMLVGTATTALAGSTPDVQNPSAVTSAETPAEGTAAPTEDGAIPADEVETPIPAEDTTAVDAPAAGNTEDPAEGTGETAPPAEEPAAPAEEKEPAQEPAEEVVAPPVAEEEPEAGLAGDAEPQDAREPAQQRAGFVKVTQVKLTINNNELNPGDHYELDKNDKNTIINLSYAWKIADDVTDEELKALVPGDWVSLGKFPTGLPIDYNDGLYNAPIQLKHGSTLIATVIIQPDGDIRLTFEGTNGKANISGMTDISGKFGIIATITRTTSEVPGETVKFDDEGGSTYYFDFDTPSEAATVAKTALNKGKNNKGTIDWQIDVNTELAKNAPNVITDTINTDPQYGTHAFKSADEIKVYKLNVVYGDGGGITQGAQLTAGALGEAGKYHVKMKSDGSGFTVTIGDGPISGAYRIVAKSHYSFHEQKYDQTKSTEKVIFGNTASYNNKTSSDETTETMPQLYSKSGKYVKDDATGIEYIEWTITVNKGKEALAGTVTFADVISGGQKFVSNAADAKIGELPAYVLKKNNTGSSVWNNASHMTGFNINGSTLSFSFAENVLKGNSYTLTLRTLVEPQRQKRTTEVTANNTMTYTLANGKSYSDDASVKVGAYTWDKPVIEKSTTTTSAQNAENKSIKWRITIDPKDYSVDGMSNVVLKDTLENMYNDADHIKELELTEKSFEVKVGETTLKRNTDYTLTIKKKGTNDLPEFELKFIGNYAKLKDPVVIAYETTFKNWGNVSDDKHTIYGGKFQNSVTMTFDEQGTNRYTKIANATIPDLKITDSKTGANIITENKTIDWTLKVNLTDYTRFGISNLVIKDTLDARSSDLTLPYHEKLGAGFKDTLKIIDKGNSDRVLTAADYTLVYDPDGYTFTLKFDKKFSPKGELVITYTTRFNWGDPVANPTGNKNEYTALLGGKLGNKYTIDFDLGKSGPGWGHGTNKPNHITIEGGGEATIPGKKVSAVKDAAPNTEKNKITWTITVDPKDYAKAKEISKLTITDTITDPSGTAMVSSKDLEKSKFVIAETGKDAATYSENYTLTVTGKSFKLEFKEGYTPTGTITITYVSDLVWADPVSDIDSKDNGTTFGGKFVNNANVQFKLKNKIIDIPLTKDVTVKDKTVSTAKKNTKVDVAARKISWEITVNKNTYTDKEMNSLVIKDTLEDVDGDIRSLPFGDDFKVVVYDGSKKLTNGTEYTLTWDKDGTTFEVTFDKNYSPKGIIKVTYDSYFEWTKTTVVDENGKPVGEGNTGKYILGGNVKNTADISFKIKDKDVNFKEEAPANIPPQEIDLTKTGKYNKETGLLDWTITFNSSKVDLGGKVTLTDTFGTDPAHSFADGTLAVSKNGTDITADTTAYTFNLLQNDPAKGFKMTFEDGNATYVITFSTEALAPLVDKQVFKNSAVLEVGQLKAEAEGDAKVETQDKDPDAISKKVKSSGNLDTTWEITLNKNKRKIKDAVLTDVASSGLIVDLKSLVVKAGETTLEKGKHYTLATEGSHLADPFETKLIITFIDDYNPLSETVTITYDTTLNMNVLKNTDGKLVKDYGGKARVSNKATLSGWNVLSSSTVTDTKQSIRGYGEANAVPMNVKIHKIDSEIETKDLKGAKFILWDEDRMLRVAELETDSSGIAKIDEILTGTYWLEETKAPDDYYLPSNPDDRFQKLVVSSKDKAKADKDGYVTYDIENDRLYSVQALKLSTQELDAVGGEELSGALFTLKNVDTGETWKNLETGMDGYTPVVKVTKGKYTFTETKAPNGYELSAAPVTFTVGQDSTASKDPVTVTDNGNGFYSYAVEFKNLLSRFEIQVLKVDSETGEPLAGAIFELTDEHGDPVLDITTGMNFAPVKTDAKGMAIFENLKMGTYKVTETGRPANYYMPANNSFNVTLPADANNDYIYTRTVENDPKEYTFNLFKHDATSRAALAGAEFSLEGPVTKTLKTDRTGYASVNGLPAGTYTLTETKAPKGYDLDSTPKTVIINDSQADANDTVSIDVANGRTFAIRVIKSDAETRAALANVEFRVVNSEGQSVGNIVTGRNGEGTLSGLAEGNYTIIETKALDGYVPNTRTYRVSLPGDANINDNNTAEVNITNTRETYGLRIFKTDATNGDALRGAEFRIANSNNETVGTITTNINGIATLRDLPADTYTIEETRAPNGYELDIIVKTVKLPARNATNGVVTINITNTPSTDTPAVPIGPATPPDGPVAPPILPAVPVVPAPGAGPAVPGGGAPPAVNIGNADPAGQILNNDVPLGGLEVDEAWSLLNLMMSLIAIFSSIILFVTIFTQKRHRDDEEDEQNAEQRAQNGESEEEQEEEKQTLRKRLLALRLPAILLGLIPGILFLILENIRLPVTWITQWTPIIGAFFIISMAVVIVHFAIRRRIKSKDDEDDQTSRPQNA